MGQKVRFAREIARTMLNFYATAAAAGATTVETAITLTRSAGTAATSTGVSFVLTTGKQFCLTSATFQHVGHATATTAVTTFSVRVNTGGAVIVSSTPIIAAARVSTPATTQAVDRVQVFFDPPIEIAGDGTIQFGVTAVSVFTTNAPTWDVMLTGYEYNK